MAEAAFDDEPATCPSCSALLPPEARFCDACGQAVAKRKHAGGPGDVLERSRANLELTQALLAIKRLRQLFLMGTGLSVLILAFLLLLRRHLPGGDGDDGSGTAAILILALQAAMLGIGSWQAPRHPVPWSIVGAAHVTLTMFLFLLGLVESIPESGLGSLDFRLALALILMSVGSWTVVGRMMRMRTLLARYPDLRISRKIEGRAPVVEESAVRARARDRRQTEARAARRRNLLLGGLLAVVALAVGLGAWIATRPPAFEPVLDRFADAWATGDADRLAGFFPGDQRASKQKGLVRILEGRGWRSHPPAIDRRSVEVSRTGGRLVTLGLGGGAGDLETVWRLDGSEWVLSQIRFPSR